MKSERERGVRMKSVGLLAVGYVDLHSHQNFLQRQARSVVDGIYTRSFKRPEWLGITLEIEFILANYTSPNLMTDVHHTINTSSLSALLIPDKDTVEMLDRLFFD